jgi:hypothetical protein
MMPLLTGFGIEVGTSLRTRSSIVAMAFGLPFATIISAESPTVRVPGVVGKFGDRGPAASGNIGLPPE